MSGAHEKILEMFSVEHQLIKVKPKRLETVCFLQGGAFKSSNFLLTGLMWVYWFDYEEKINKNY